jgi:hypothetical protein
MVDALLAHRPEEVPADRTETTCADDQEIGAFGSGQEPPCRRVVAHQPAEDAATAIGAERTLDDGRQRFVGRPRVIGRVEPVGAVGVQLVILAPHQDGHQLGVASGCLASRPSQRDLAVA